MLSNRKVETAYQCVFACDSDSSCQFWSYDLITNACYIKGDDRNVGTPISGYFVSGPKQCTAEERANFDVLVGIQQMEVFVCPSKICVSKVIGLLLMK